MNIADIIFLVLTLFFVIKSFFKGFLSEFMSMAALICGITVGMMFKDKLAPMLADLVKSTTWRPVAAFFILFIGTYILIKITEILLKNIITKIQLNSLDRILGIVWGVLEAAVIITLIVFLIYALQFEPGMNFLKKSEIANYALEFLRKVNLDQQLKNLPLVGDLHV